ncbi:hypothetical protein ACLKA7_001562 [Drosophila subpalustris]
MRPTLTADRRREQQRPPLKKKNSLQVVENREDCMIPIGANYVDHDASGTSGTSSRGCRRRLHWLRQRSQDLWQSKTGHRLTKVAGQQEAQDERPSTSAAAGARLSTSSAPTEPRTSYASVAKKVKVAVLPVGCPQASKDDIVSRGHQLFFRFGTIPVGGLKKGAEKAGTVEAVEEEPWFNDGIKGLHTADSKNCMYRHDNRDCIWVKALLAFTKPRKRVLCSG